MTERALSTKDKLLLAGGALTVAAGGVVVGSGYISQKEGQIQEDPSKNQAAEAMATPYNQLLRPITPTEAAVIATATRKPTSTEVPASPTTAPATATETQVPPTATGTATATAIVTARPTETPTPERPKLGDYNVWTGNIEGGGKLMIATLENGRLIFVSFKNDVRCSEPTYTPLTFTAVGNFQSESFDFSSRTKQLSGKLAGSNIITGVISEAGFEGSSPKGRFVCPAGKFSYSAQNAGKNKNAVIAAYRSVAWGLYAFQPGTTDAQVQEALERDIRFKLP